jgi:CCR4-NOT transcription complex subunit 7/8
LTFLDENGNPPPGISTWQFNFSFQITEDIYAQNSIDLLANSGIQFARHQREGIEPNDFAELLISSGIVLMDNIKWIGFHSGYDFGYLLKILSGDIIPDSEKEFFDVLRLYFPVIYDIKYLMESCKNLKGLLTEI